MSMSSAASEEMRSPRAARRASSFIRGQTLLGVWTLPVRFRHPRRGVAPKQGRAAIEEYWRTITADQRDVKFESKVISTNGNTGVAHWKATFRLQSTGATIALDGVFVLEFDDQGVCKSLREWWHVKAG